MRFLRLGTERGLAQNTVFDVLQDRKGFLWIATGDGLCRWDGYNVQVFRHNPKDSLSLPPAQITSLLEDTNGTLWIATLKGLFRFHAREHLFKPYPVASQISPKKFSFQNRTVTILEHGLRQDSYGRILVATETGLFVVDTVQKVLRPASSVWNGADSLLSQRCGFFPNAQHEIIIALERERGTSIGLLRNPERLFVLQKTSVAEITLPKRGSETLIPSYRDQQGTWWFWQRSTKAVFRWNERTRELEREKRLGFAEMYSIFDDNQGRHWISDTVGFGVMSPDYRTFQRLEHSATDSSSISQGYVSTWMGNLRDGTIWISNDGGGVNFLRRKPKFNSSPQLPWTLAQTNSVRGIACDKVGNLWIGALGSGLIRYSPASKQIEQVGTLGVVKPVLCDKQGTIWAANETGGLWEVRNAGTNKETRQFHDLKERTNWFLSIVEDSSGALWLGGMTHLCRFDKQTHCITHKYGGFNAPELFVAKDKRLWVGNTDGISVFQPDVFAKAVMTDTFAIAKSSTQEVMHFVHDEKIPLSLSDNNVKCFYEDERGRMWIGTVNGLNVMNTITGQCRIYTTSDGLPNNYVYGIQPDAQGNVWVSTNNGLAKFSEERSTWRVYSTFDGLPSNEFNRSASCRFPDGRLVFGGVNGFTIFQPENIIDNTSPPPVAIVDIAINDRPYEQVFMGFPKDAPQARVREVSELKELVLRWTENTLTFDFAALDFTDPTRNLYAYKMEGIDNDWVQSGTLRKTRYAGLNAGEYTFRVRACNSDGVWNEVGTTLKITILPPFWQRAWFLALCFVVAVISIGGGTRFIVRQRFQRRIERLEAAQMLEREQMQRELALERERGRIARDIHDEVGPGMMRIAILAETVEEGNIGTSEHIAETALEVIDAMNGIIWMTNPKNDTLDNLSAYLQEKTGEWFERIGATKGMTLDFALPDEVPALILGGDVRRNLYLSIREALNNAVKHSEATHIELALLLFGEGQNLTRFEWRVSDNGIGFDKTNVSPFSNGLMNMQSRLEEIGGECEIVNRLEQGTMVIFRVSRNEQGSFVRT